MSQGNPSCLRFSLEESVWFRKGQEVSDLISISLDPDILIQENDQYVTIQGALELSGEYRRHEAEELEQEDGSLTAPKFIQVVEERNEGICEFNHFFPVDITIPKHRIENVSDIDVLVESFDYVFPERSCMKLTANLTISGLYGEQQQKPVMAEEREFESTYQQEETPVELNWNMQWSNDHLSEEETVTDTETIFTPFEAEARKQQELIEAAARNEEQFFMTNTEQEKHAVDKQPEISFSAQRSEESPPSAKNVYNMPKMEESPLEEVKIEVEIENVSESSILESSSDEESEDEKEEAVHKKKKKLFKKKSMSLTEFFARKAEDNVAKLKVCIVQNGDTIDIIAERYDVPVNRLLSVNHLEINQDIYEGQVLYIPVAVAHK